MRYARLRMADAVHQVLLTSADLYAETLEAYQVRMHTTLALPSSACWAAVQPPKRSLT